MQVTRSETFMDNPFQDRGAAGRRLAEELRLHSGRSDVLILTLTNGGTVVGEALSEALEAPLEVFSVRKLLVPGNEEVAMGAVATGGIRAIDQDVVAAMKVPHTAIERVASREEAEIRRREGEFRGSRPEPDLRGRIIILVDDGLVMGTSLRAAILCIRQRAPARVIVAVPMATVETLNEYRQEADEVVCPITPEPFFAVGLGYEEFSQVGDRRVREILDRASRRQPAVSVIP